MKKGFTLIELLAVIVILAIIALIAVPIIMNIINDAKKEGNERSIDLYAQAVKNAVVSYQMKENKEPTSFSDIESYIKYDGSEVICSVKGINNDGSIYLSDCKVEGNEIEYIYGNAPICVRATVLHQETCSADGMCSLMGNDSGKVGKITTFGNLGAKGTLNSDDAFDCDVDGDGKYGEYDEVTGKYTERFYYVSDYYDGYTNTFDEDIAVLIYYSTTKNGLPDITTSSKIYYNEESTDNFGPVTAKTNLPTVEQWSNVSLKNKIRQITNEEGSLTTPNGNTVEFDYTGYAARLLTYQELNSNCSSPTVNPGCSYIVESIKYFSNSGVDGYFLETISGLYGGSAWVMTYQPATNPTLSGKSNVRPVIEVAKTDINY